MAPTLEPACWASYFRFCSSGSSESPSSVSRQELTQPGYQPRQHRRGYYRDQHKSQVFFLLSAVTEYDDTSIANELGKIHTLSHQVEEYITSQLPFRQRYGNFLMRLREKSPMWYTLLMTQFCDEVSKTPFSDWNEKQIAHFMVDGLYQPRGGGNHSQHCTFLIV